MSDYFAHAAARAGLRRSPPVPVEPVPSRHAMAQPTDPDESAQLSGEPVTLDVPRPTAGRAAPEPPSPGPPVPSWPGPVPIATPAPVPRDDEPTAFRAEPPPRSADVPGVLSVPPMRFEPRPEPTPAAPEFPPPEFPPPAAPVDPGPVDPAPVGPAPRTVTAPPVVGPPEPRQQVIEVPAPPVRAEPGTEPALPPTVSDPLAVADAILLGVMAAPALPPPPPEPAAAERSRPAPDPAPPTVVIDRVTVELVDDRPATVREPAPRPRPRPTGQLRAGRRLDSGWRW